MKLICCGDINVDELLCNAMCCEEEILFEKKAQFEKPVVSQARMH